MSAIRGVPNKNFDKTIKKITSKYNYIHTLRLANKMNNENK